jgi:hypothetical protein
MSDIINEPDNPNRFMDDRLNLQALKNKRYLDQSTDFDFYTNIDKKDLLEMLLKSTILLYEGATHIAKQRSDLIRFQMKEIRSL